MTFTIIYQSRRVCAHPAHPAHSALLLHSCLVPHLSRGTLPRAAGPSAPRRSPHGAAPEAADCDLRLAAGGGASAAATARAAADAALPAARLGRGRREGAGHADAPFVFHAADPSSSYSAWLLRAAPRPPRQQQRRRRRRRRSRSRTVGKRGRGRGAAAPRCSPRGCTKGTAVACCRLAGRLSAAGVLVPPGVARLPRRPLAVAVVCAMSIPDGAVAAAADPAAAGLLAPILFRPRAATAAAGAMPPAGPLRAPLVEGGVARPVPVGGHRLRRGGGVPGTTGAWEAAGGGVGRLDRPPRWPAVSRARRRHPCLRP